MTNSFNSYTFGLIAIFLTGFFFIYLKEVLQPMLYAIILSATILPWVKFLIRWKIPEILAIILSLMSIYVLIFLISWWTYSSLSIFQTDYPIIQNKAITFFNEMDNWLKAEGIEGYDIVRSKLNEILIKGSEIIGSALVMLSSLAGNLILATIYSFLMLMYRKNIYIAFEAVLGEHQKENTSSFFGKLSTTLSGYILGVIQVQILVFCILWFLLGISGIGHSLFFAFLGAFLNIIPYLGIFSVGLAVSLYSVLMYGSWGFMVWAFIIFWITHVIEANFITPKIMGKIMNLNPLATIFFIILAGNLWGFSGMILALPITATLRIILEHSRSLNPWALFLKG